VVVAAAILAVYFGTAASIEAIWRRAETFAHVTWSSHRALASGAGVPRSAQVPVKPFWPGLAAVAPFGALWLVASTLAVLGIEQFALLFMIQAAVVTIVGLQVRVSDRFPLAFLLFAVPFGEIFVPRLIDWTADFTVLAVQASGVPVYREGNQFNIPSGAWSVVEACSGIRYLIAALMGSTLYAYLTYRAPGARGVLLASLGADRGELAPRLHDRDARTPSGKGAGRRSPDLRLDLLRCRDPAHVLDRFVLARGRATATFDPRCRAGVHGRRHRRTE
jgi:exosortase